MADINDIISSISSSIKAPTKDDVIYLGECSVTGYKDIFEDGVFIDLLSFESLSLKFLKDNYNRMSQTNSQKEHRFYLNIKKKKKLLENIEVSEVKNLAINAEGGFNSKKVYEYEVHYSIYDLETNTYIKLEKLDENTRAICESIINHKNEEKKENINKWINEIKESKYAKDLIQLPNIKIKNENIQCAVCKSKKNIWLNLSDGYIGCGRKIYNYGGGCLNNEEGASLKHYYESGKIYPLVVKIGTITKEGEADVFSYADDENDSVIDPYIGSHLKNLGINIMNLEKTEITTLEKEIQENKNINFSSILDKNIEVICEQGKVGFVNLGNTCYMNCALQILLSIKDISYRYLQSVHDFLRSLDISKKAHEDLFMQYTKLCYMIFQDDYIKKKKSYIKKFKDECTKRDVQVNYDSDIDEENCVSINPTMFRNCLNQKTNSFCNNNQQDIYEYLAYLLNELIDNENNIFDRLLKGGSNSRNCAEMDKTLGTITPEVNTSGCSSHMPKADSERSLFNFFTFEVEQTIVSQGRNNSVSSFQNNILSLDIPLDSSLLKEQGAAEGGRVDETGAGAGAGGELENVKISLIDCLKNYVKKDIIEDYYCEKEKTRVSAEKNVKLKNFPPYLFIHLKRFYADENWCAQKINIPVEADEYLDLEFMRAEKGVAMSMVANGASSSDGNFVATGGPSVEEQYGDVLASLIDLGFEKEKAVEAIKKVKVKNVNNCISYIYGEDSVELDVTTSSSKDEVNTDKLDSILSMGIKKEVAMASLLINKNDLQKSIDYIFTNMDLLTEGKCDLIINSHKCDDGPANYELVASIEHIGRNANSGHYICYIKDNSLWYVCNDNKVGLCSANFGKDVAYIHLYKRV
ncbi:ubiquitin carboxyl-terminal hydrolase 13, putative (USP13) [Plasmodium ovale wallikeri]|uniref:Ubiquitin carboxyl-terminal hydrolase n=2 Tax=Plasmodium ovale TaxID=36330 RepID=A0A1C3KPE8_PLAOA|nr:ubiquitin carboxyl-terminal hydrolase 13, putative (USP13) [Plasmodium ovale wallikeri]SBT75920.1 ubiquitin carboxyl-terminal hydrolase 13, putative [Plasmodium ovale]